MNIHVSIPLPSWHWCYEPDNNEMMDVVESRILMAACAKFDMPRVLELGTFRGGTTTNLAKIAKARSGKVITVDVLEAPDSLPLEQKGEVKPVSEIGSLIPDKYRDCIEQVLVDPKTNYYAQLEKYAPYDVMFFDGDHSLEGIERDISETQHMLSAGGMRFLHDVWWDGEPPPVTGPLEYLNGKGYILNFTHMGMLTEDELKRLGGCKC